MVLANYAPDVYFSWQQMITGTALEDDTAQLLPDQSVLKSLIQDILSSEQGKALVSDIIRTQAPLTWRQMLEEATGSVEFRETLVEALDSFFKTEEGATLIRRVVEDAMRR
jgi:hypothetical protein